MLKNYLETAGIDPKRRAETLSIPEWATLTDAFANNLHEHIARIYYY